MLIRISLIVAIVAGLATAIIGFTELKTRLQDTIQARDDFNNKWTTETQNHNRTKRTLTETEETLAVTKRELETTTAQRNTLLSEKEQLTQANLALTQQRDEYRQSRDGLQQQLNRWEGLNITVDGVREIIANRRKLEAEKEAVLAENSVLFKKNTALQDKIDIILGPNQPVELPETIRGEVVAVDPKFDFVVINVGGDAGVKERGELLVNRNGNLIGKLRVASVSPTHSIANILPEWKSKTEEILEGDKVLP